MDVPGDAITKLYAVPLGAFTRERNALATALAKTDAARARAVRQLRRPSAPLWAANQLAHAESARLEAFFDHVAAVRKAQLRDPRSAAEALTGQRRELQYLVRRAGALLAEHGTRATPETERRIFETLLGAAVDRHHTDELRHGRLTQELAAPGFEVLAGSGGGGHLRLVSGGQADGQRSHEVARKRQDAARQREAATRSREEVAARQREEAAQRQREMAERRAAVEQAEQEAQELTARLAAARQRLAEARRAAKSAATTSRAKRPPTS